MIRQLGLSLRLSLLYAALFATYGVSLPFLPLWLEGRGMGPAEIGIIIGIPVLVRVAAAPLASEIADRWDRPVWTMRVLAAAALGFYLLLAWMQGFWGLLIVACLVAGASGGIPPLCDSLIVRAFRERPRVFGIIRLWASVSFVAASAIAGAAIEHWSAESIIWLLVLLQGLGLMAALAYGSGTPRAAGAREATPPSRLLFIPGLMIAVIATALVQSSHAAFYALGPVHWRSLGFDGPQIGLLWSIGVVAEILLFIGSAWIPARFGPAQFLIIGATAAVVRWTAMTYEPGLSWLVWLQALHAFSFAATYLGMMRAAAAFGVAGVEARVQGFSSMLQGLAMAAAMALSGPAYASFGGLVFGIMAAIAGCGGLVVLLGWRFLRPSSP